MLPRKRKGYLISDKTYNVFEEAVGVPPFLF
jgi:hypothetical protein